MKSNNIKKFYRFKKYKKINLKKIIIKIKKKFKIRLTGIEGEQIGITTLKNSIIKSYKLGLDLIKISSNSVPPVYRIINYSKFIYQKNKLLKIQRRKRKVMQTKEIKFRPNTDKGDYIIKLRNLTRFLKKGSKTKISLIFKGREITHKQIGVNMLNNIKNDLKHISNLEFFSTKIEGRQMVMMLSPKK
ncbi:Translation initiation factor IF-3 [Candidatus Annandia adelgestsuga]|uniref:Translation initiation factor IF-3 n=1 Tax=Candidatus Annandia adelgestsuga TaxID=1302411 RepID=A0A3S9J7V6_9ENTR|nr:translation initiation factor IF-3 [Candidatus Annandia adelgestsuga]AZP36400.1 Translation initiation factor IF-3 [Candidatus Annandia adelgestsuga]